jgi:hypothetical protein
MLTDGLETHAVPMHTAAIGVRRGGRVVEGAPLLREYTSKAYRGFESLPLRHPISHQWSPVQVARGVRFLLEFCCLCTAWDCKKRFPKVSFRAGFARFHVFLTPPKLPFCFTKGVRRGISPVCPSPGRQRSRCTAVQYERNTGRGIRRRVRRAPFPSRIFRLPKPGRGACFMGAARLVRPWLYIQVARHVEH